MSCPEPLVRRPSRLEWRLAIVPQPPIDPKTRESMIRSGPIVAGGGWKSRSDCRAELWQIVVFLIVCIAALSVDGRVGGWVLLVGAMLFLASFILLRWNRSRTWFGMPGNQLPTPDRATSETTETVSDIPRHDLHNLH